MRSHEKRQPVAVQRRTTATDSQGGQAVTWTTAYTMRAKVMGLTGAERIAAAQVSAQQVYKLTCDFRKDLSPEMRLLWKRQILEIQSLADPDGRSMWLELQCVESQKIVGAFAPHAFAAHAFDVVTVG